ncbi:penicillin-binding protein 2 [Pseudoblastomonas halimionae]|uniref:Penicillin-binding protein 2 n=1 Tax=Alteriqipengyuania halimionae TaxID=1926630 RepID=A0A6I4U3U8_9SPHN|nr:penicillin-binding protein 2 [Alteriqipengyuania halimionae]MXP09593.1 penicillin-binding protein 2 [Alteriqipengyuania halimionae]
MFRRRRPRSFSPPPTGASLQNVFDRRSVIIGSVQAGVGLLLVGRMAYIGVAENERYEVLSESNRVNLSLIPPRRGAIVDRYGTPVAANRADFRVDLIPERMGDRREASLDQLASVLKLSDTEMTDLRDRIEQSNGFQAVEVASNLDYQRFAAISVRLPDMPGVVAQQGYTRNYPTGPAVGHLLGYVGTANKEEYEAEDKPPLLVTPGFKIGKDGLEKQFEERLRGEPGARRTEVTASGRIVRELETREDTPGAPLRLTINAALQDYAARRLGPESGAVVVLDTVTGDILAMASMPSFDPNSFSDGIGRVEYSMLNEDDHKPLLDKTLRSLYPPGSTVKPGVSLAFLKAGLDPNETVYCGGGLQVGNRYFRCWKRGGHGTVDMAKGIYQSCDTYFYHFAQKVGMSPITAELKDLGMGQEFPLPFVDQYYGTVPGPEWMRKKYDREWQAYDTVNSTIGQGYMLASPLQVAVMSARIAMGRKVMPRIIASDKKPQFESLGFNAEQIAYIRQAMSDVVNGPGTAGRARLPIDNVLLAGKTGTAQVVGLNISDGKSGPWKYRDHGHFMCFAPFDNPRYACAVTIQHGGGSGAAYPVARDVLTFLYDPDKALELLHGYEKAWGGTAQARLAAKYRAAAAAAGETLPPGGGSAPGFVASAKQGNAIEGSAETRASDNYFKPEATNGNPGAGGDSSAARPAAGTPAPSPSPAPRTSASTAGDD